MVPAKAEVVHNPVGTAPGHSFQRRTANVFFALPGVPYEMKAIVDGRHRPVPGKPQVTGAVIRHLTLRTTGIAESLLATAARSTWRSSFEGATLAFLPSPTGVRLTLTVKGTRRRRSGSGGRRIEAFRAKRRKICLWHRRRRRSRRFSGGSCRQRRLRLAVAESCTGGLIADRITKSAEARPTSSGAWWRTATVRRSELLGVPEELFDAAGAVSEEVAAAMAAGVRDRGTDLGLSTTGIAGPTGGSEPKPVGLVWIGYADAQESLAVSFQFGGPRRVSRREPPRPHRTAAEKAAGTWTKSQTTIDARNDALQALRGGRYAPGSEARSSCGSATNSAVRSADVRWEPDENSIAR